MGRPDMAYFRIVSALLTSTEFQLFGDGHIRRDFTYIDDAIQSVALLAEQLDSISEEHSDVVNVGGGRPQTMTELIETAEKLTGSKLHVIEMAAHSNDVQRTEADTKLIEKLTGFKPSISIEEGMAKFLEWARREGVSEYLNSWVTSSR
jgi:UDP-glucuronate 4-epimerase